VINHSIELNESETGWWCVNYQQKVLLPSPASKLPFGTFSELNLPIAKPKIVHHIGYKDESPVYLVQVLESDFVANEQDFAGLRQVLYQQPDMFEYVARAFQVNLFLKTHKYCGQCGNEMELIDWELATHCQPCNHRCYPRISPCIIVAIRKGNEILLAQGAKSTSGMYSVLAGFVESGETLEQAVHREVFEEVGIKVKNLKYFGSQPWPFPHSLMMGYTAEYAGGEITICEDEILAADWFTLETMPETPPTLSISGQLIERTKAMMKLA
jgi:NAD+ diphosphatase